MHAWAVMPSRPPRLRTKRAPSAEHQQRKANDREYDRRRGSAAKRGYGPRWRKAREGWLAQHPLCAECEKRDRIRPATDVDHIIPHKGDMALFWDRSNWQSLCHACHSRKTAREDGRWGDSGPKS